MEVSDRVVLATLGGGGMLSDCRRDGGLLSRRELSSDVFRGSWLGLS